MNVAIVGYGLEGQAAYEYWHAGNDITICDQSSSLDLPADVHSQLGLNYLADLSRFDLIVRSPGIHPRLLVEAASADILTKVTTNTNEFLKVSPTKNVVAVTGTKGKGTTTTLIAKMLEAAGKQVYLGGNIGVAPLTLLKQNISADSWVALELSNFQLIDLKRSPYLAVCLMVKAEHLDWHADIEEYIIAKTQLFRHQTAADIAIYNAFDKNSRRIVSTSAAWQVPYMQTPGAYVQAGQIIVDSQVICRTDELKLLGEHNWQNVCAAVTAVWKISQDLTAIKSVLTSFGGLEHRIEFVQEVHGVKYYDDSFGTTPDTAIVALQALPQPKILILGGSDKAANYEQLALAVNKNNVRKVLLIGEQAGRLQAALEKAGFMNFEPGGNSMPEIVERAQNLAANGDVVLLSPACASFGMFKNYKDRGEQFKQAVQALA
jgi:UDP-N-acetylmuramoylalanine--D-glutamate ligase